MISTTILSGQLSAEPVNDPAFPKGIVATDHVLASAAGLQMLKLGGNAVDAACAAAFALGVVNPAGSGIGGGGFMLIRKATSPRVQVLDFRETAPAAASREMYLKPGLSPEASRWGGLAVATPGELLGCAEALRGQGRLKLALVLIPAIAYAERGFPAGEHLVRTIKRMQQKLRESPRLARVFLPGGKPPEIGQLLFRPALARTLKTIARRGVKAFYQGKIARAIVGVVQADGGMLTLKDLATYRVKERRVLVSAYRGYRVHTMPPPSSGGVALIEMLNILERFPKGSAGHASTEYQHRLTEAMKHAFADRARYLGDTDFVQVPIRKLTSKAYAASLARRLGPRPLPAEQYGSRDLPRAPSGGTGGTSHISVMDRQGMAVAFTTTINTAFGSGLVAGETGIILNNEMDDFAARPGKPNAFGLIQSESNCVSPRKRPLSSMTPTIITLDGKVVLVVGASGGPTIITGTLQTVLNVIDFNQGANEAVASLRLHHQWSPDQLVVEEGLPLKNTQALSKMGHRIKRIERSWSAVQLVTVRGGKLHGAADPRKGGAVAGY